MKLNKYFKLNKMTQRLQQIIVINIIYFGERFDR